MQGSVRKRGNKWYYSFEAASVDGKRKRIERVGGTTKKEAESALAKAINEYDNAGQVFAPSEISVADFMDLWTEKFVEVNHRPTTITGYKGVIKNHIKPKLGHYKLKSLSKQVINDFIVGIYSQGYTKKMLTYIKTVLSGALTYAFDNDYIAVNPAIGIKLPSYKNGGKKGRERVSIDVKTFSKLTDRFPEGSNFHLALMIGFYTGLRISECYALTWDDIDLDNATIDVNKQLLKNDDTKVWEYRDVKTVKSNRVITIGTTLLNLLKREFKKQLENELRYGEYYNVQYEIKSKVGVKDVRTVQQYSKNVGNANMVGKRVKLINIRENGEMLTGESFKYASRIFRHEMHMDNFDYHTLRHSHATILIENGANVKEVSERLGHESLETTLKIYQSVTAKMKQQSIDIFEKAVGK